MHVWVFVWLVPCVLTWAHVSLGPRVLTWAHHVCLVPCMFGPMCAWTHVCLGPCVFGPMCAWAHVCIHALGIVVLRIW